LTWKDLKRFISDNSINNNDSHQEEKEIQLQSKHFEIFRNKPFWISNVEEHKAEDIRTKGHCCFNHILGLPKKDNQTLIDFSYLQEVKDKVDEQIAAMQEVL
jgi:hypothetical protein